MGFRTDSGGFAFSCNDIKLSCGSATWGTRLSQLPKQSGIVRILTYSLPSIEYVKEQFNRRPRDIGIICNSKFLLDAQELANEFPDIQVAVNTRQHAKVLLIEPQTLWIGSANFGSSKWHETCLGLHSQEAHAYYAKVFDSLWMESIPVRSQR